MMSVIVYYFRAYRQNDIKSWNISFGSLCQIELFNFML
jgi:hypothetical protein